MFCSSRTKQHHLGLQSTMNVINPPPTPPNPLFETKCIIHRTHRTTCFVHHPPNNIILVCNPQRTSLTPPTPPESPLWNQMHHPPNNMFCSSSTKQHHLGLQSTTNVINTPHPHPEPPLWNQMHHPPNNMFCSSSTKQHHLGLQSTTNVINPPPPNPPFETKCIIHRTTCFVHHPPNNIILVCNPQRTSLTPPTPRTPLWNQVHHPPNNMFCSSFTKQNSTKIAKFIGAVPAPASRN